jgi:hypothetical protein
MLNEIAIRLYDNPKYGTTYGKAQYRHAIFNGSADIKNPSVKYLLDFYEYSKWEHTANTDDQMVILNEVANLANKDTLASWIIRYNPATKEKNDVFGFAIYDLKSCQLIMAVVDTQTGIQDKWVLEAKPCRAVVGKKVASLLATNSELAHW